MQRLSIVAMVITLLGWTVQPIPLTAREPEKDQATEKVEKIEIYPGVVVESVGEISTLARAGIQPGDVLLSWKRLATPPANPEPATGKLDSPLDWWELKIEQAPRGVVQLRGEREGTPQSWAVPRGEWESKVRPRGNEIFVDLYRQGKELIDAGKTEGGVRIWQHLAEGWSDGPDTPLHVWLVRRMAEAWAEKKEWERVNILMRDWRRTSSLALAQSQALAFLGNLARQGQALETAMVFLARALEIMETTAPRSLSLAETLRILGNLALGRWDLSQAEVYYQHALAIEKTLAPTSLNVASSLHNLGVVALKRGALSLAESHYQQALEIKKVLAPQSLTVASTLNSLGIIAKVSGDSSLAKTYYQQALEIKKAQAPQSPTVASTLNNLGILAMERGDCSLAKSYYRQALVIRERLDPKSLKVAGILNNLGNLAYACSDPYLAKLYYQEALEIKAKHAPGSLDLAITLTNLGSVALERGDIAQAANYYKQALDIQKLQAPESLDLAATMNNLGLVSYERGELHLAAAYYQQALGIQEVKASKSLRTAKTLNNLGLMALDQGDFPLAENYFRQALEIKNAQSPGSLNVARTLHNLGLVAFVRQDYSRAETTWLRTLDIVERLSPQSLRSAITLNTLGELARKTGRLAVAQARLKRAVESMELLVPDSADLSEALYFLSLVQRAQGQVEHAARLLEHSLIALEAQARRLGTSREAEALFRSRDGYHIFQEAISLALGREQPRQAFQILERSRAQSYLAMLAERELVFANLPPELDQERRQLNVRYNRSIQSMQNLSPEKDAEKIEEIQAEQLLIRERQNQIEVEVRKLAPELAALKKPALNVEQVQKKLDPGTLLLAYSIAEEESFLFVLGSEHELEVHPLPTKTEDLKKRVEVFRRLVQESPETRIGRLRNARLVKHEARELYDLLLAPAQEVIESSQRVLFLPDGPLHLLPFGALRHPDGRFVAEWKPLSYALSATVWAQLKDRRGSLSAKEQPALVAFGDPRYTALEETLQRGEEIAEVRMRSAYDSCFFEDWPQLPFTRREVEEIAGLFDDGTAQVFLGTEATEEQVKALAAAPRIVHLAAHACADTRAPWNSAIVLSLPSGPSSDGDNGLLQVWEIMEGVRFDAELVVLSACETAVGEERGGEGLIGLTRAFHFAGARSVLASLWRVPDRSTSELMIRFYRHFRAGKPKDEALQLAKIELIREPVAIPGPDGKTMEMDASAPHYWAAFQLHGDWK